MALFINKIKEYSLHEICLNYKENFETKLKLSLQLTSSHTRYTWLIWSALTL